MTKRSKHRPSDATIDRDWPHQVALPNDLCTDPNFTLIMNWFSDHGVEQMTRHVTAIWSELKQEEWRLHCFREPAHAQSFIKHFGGRGFDPKKDRHKGLARGAWYQTGEWQQITASGPLRLNPVFLRGPDNMEYDR